MKTSESKPLPHLPIDVSAMAVRYGRTEAVGCLSLQVEAGTALGLLGPNGAGKSTTLMALAGILRPYAGGGSVLDAPLGKIRPQQLQRLGFVSESQEYPRDWTLQKLIWYLAPLYPSWDQEFCDRMVAAFNVPRALKLGQLSRGQMMKARLISNLAYRPELLLLDEPFSGLDPVSREDVIDGLLELMTGGNWTVVLATHEMVEVERLCDQVCLIDYGEAHLNEPLEDLQGRFRRWRLRLKDDSFEPGSRHDWPGSWLGVRREGDTVELVDAAAPDGDRRALFVKHFGELLEAESETMDLTEIYVAIQRGRRPSLNEQRRFARSGEKEVVLS